MKVVLYTTHCPKCKVLALKLKQKNVEFEEEENVDKMIAMGLKNAPALQVDEGDLMDFAAAVKWVNAYGNN